MFLLLLIAFAIPSSSHGGDGMVLMPPGSYVPFIAEIPPKERGEERPQERKPVQVDAFFLDAHPVTNQDFLEFVRMNSKWMKSQVKPIFADKQYLKHWRGDADIGNPKIARSPVTYVSWFAASAYCRWKGKALPTVDQWEYAAYDRGRNAEDNRKRLLKWHGEPNPPLLPSVGSTPKNGYGVSDLLGLVWEWTLDFNSAMMPSESRSDAAGEDSLFCGGGSIGSRDALDYPAFMRFGFSNSLRSNYTIGNLGFRCAKEVSK